MNNWHQEPDPDAILCSECHKPLDIGFNDTELDGELYHDDCADRVMEQRYIDDVDVLEGASFDAQRAASVADVLRKVS